jgi:hypothetical protein
VCSLLQGKVATAARESKGNFFIKLGKQLVNPHKKIFKVTAAARPCSSVGQRTALHDLHNLSLRAVALPCQACNCSLQGRTGVLDV